MTFFRPTRTKIGIFALVALPVIISNACMAFYIPPSTGLTTNSFRLLNTGSRPLSLSLCDNGLLNLFAYYRVAWFAPLVLAVGDIFFVTSSKLQYVLFLSTVLDLMAIYACVCSAVQISHALKKHTWQDKKFYSKCPSSRERLWKRPQCQVG
jgi:hypothetical protein